MQGRELWKKKREIKDHTHRIVENSESNLTFRTITMEFERNTRVQEKVKRNEEKK